MGHQLYGYSGGRNAAPRYFESMCKVNVSQNYTCFVFYWLQNVKQKNDLIMSDYGKFLNMLQVKTAMQSGGTQWRKGFDRHETRLRAIAQPNKERDDANTRSGTGSTAWPGGFGNWRLIGWEWGRIKHMNICVKRIDPYQKQKAMPGGEGKVNTLTGLGRKWVSFIRSMVLSHERKVSISSQDRLKLKSPFAREAATNTETRVIGTASAMLLRKWLSKDDDNRHLTAIGAFRSSTFYQKRRRASSVPLQKIPLLYRMLVEANEWTADRGCQLFDEEWTATRFGFYWARRVIRAQYSARFAWLCSLLLSLFPTSTIRSCHS
ncbi:hypothetical protein BD410DRAFT_807209 [Rickenella mellea]|uniref:Uncharacterized protein n=1 Tax=Rickenella mellea TaxID=50990 RepID=A0A4Y7PR72_9AGAM|nr:hypothetical protein BD410DRAFT_807209 [Rickenella mellea]